MNFEDRWTTLTRNMESAFIPKDRALAALFYDMGRYDVAEKLRNVLTDNLVPSIIPSPDQPKTEDIKDECTSSAAPSGQGTPSNEAIKGGIV